MGLFGKSKTSELSLVLDIQSGSVGGAFVLKEKGTVPLILHATRKNFRLTEHTSNDRTKEEMLQMVDLVCMDLQREVQMKPKKIYCVLGTPWSHGELRTVKMERSADFRFTEKLAQKLVGAEAEKFKKEWENLKQIIDQRLTKVLLNGYSVDNPHTKSARSLELHVFMSLAPMDVVRRIEERIHKTFKARVALTSQMFSDFIVVRDIFELQNDFIIVNVGSTVTEVSIMKHGALVGTAFFPYGEESLVRDIAKGLNKNLFEAKSLLALHVEGALSESASMPIASAASHFTDVWLQFFKGILESLSPTRHLPSHIFFTSVGRAGEMLSEYLKHPHFPEFTTTHEDFSVILGNTRTLHNFCDFTERAERDPSLAIKAIFINQV